MSATYIGMDFEAFRNEEKTIDAVIRNIEIVGEAARYIPKEIEQRYPEVPWRQMNGMRNVLAHDYGDLLLPVIWETAVRNLPSLRPLLQDILSHEG